MYCFSAMCRICLRSLDKRFTNLNNLDTDSDTTKIIDMLVFCIPEISSQHNLPQQICKKCHKFLRRMHSFKQMCLRNTAKLNKYASKLSNGAGSSRNSKVYINLDYIDNENNFKMTNLPTVISTPKSDLNKSLQYIQTETFSPIVTDLQGTSMYSISLNQWDLFETKFSCCCIKNFNSFTEKTEHLCKNCEGDLLGFRLSKLKVNVLENRFNNSRRVKEEDEDSRSSLIEENNFDYSTNDSQDYELGFDYSDISLSKVHMNSLKKQIENLESGPTEYNNYGLNISESPAYCTISYKNNNIVSSHFKSLSYKRYYCDFCEKSYTKRYRLKLHLVEKHPEFKFFTCLYCPKEFLQNSDFKKHMLKHTNNSKLKNKPERFFISKHKKTENTTSKRKHHKAEDTSELSVSKKLNSDENLNCATCKKSFTHKSNFAIHLLTHVGKKEYKCKVCQKEFFRKENLDEHVLTHSNPAQTESKYKCRFCPKGYNHPQNLQRHMRLVHLAQKYNCSMCEKQFLLKTELQTHIFDEHNQFQLKPIIDISIEENQYPCPVCKKVFQHVNNLKMHALSHIEIPDVEQFICCLCSKVFCSKANLKRHEALHTEVRIKTCKMCFKMFNNKDYLQAHMLEEHLNVWKHKCPICGKLYQSSTSLKRHNLAVHITNLVDNNFKNLETRNDIEQVDNLEALNSQESNDVEQLGDPSGIKMNEFEK